VAGALAPIIPVGAAGAFTQAMMELGATVCLPNGAPQCERCPVAQWCLAREREDFSFPKKPPKKERTIEQRPVWLLFWQGQVALRRRPEKGLLAGLYEYPDDPGSLAFTGEEAVGQAVHIFTHKEWHMEARAAESLDGMLPDGWVWADLTDWQHTYSIPSAFSAFAPYVERRLHRKER